MIDILDYPNLLRSQQIGRSSKLPSISILKAIEEDEK